MTENAKVLEISDYISEQIVERKKPVVLDQETLHMFDMNRIAESTKRREERKRRLEEKKRDNTACLIVWLMHVAIGVTTSIAYFFYLNAKFITPICTLAVFGLIIAESFILTKSYRFIRGRIYNKRFK